MTTPGDQGRFDGFDVIAQSGHWDRVTQGVVLRRLGPPGPLRFFTESEGALARALLDALLGQYGPGPRIDVLADIDSRLALGVTDGWHHEDLPADGRAWQDTLAALDSRDFARLDAAGQDGLLQEVLDAGQGQWQGMPAPHLWGLWTRYACAAFYSHPHAWNEIGFGGPAYPRGYANLGLDRREHWERPERDAQDPVPWAERSDTARRQHTQRRQRS